MMGLSLPRLTAYCQSRHLACFDLTPAIIAASEGSDEPLYKKRDGHWTIQGNRVAAQAQAAYLAGLDSVSFRGEVRNGGEPDAHHRGPRGEECGVARVPT